MKFVAEPPPTLQPLGYATKFVAEPPPTLQPEYLFGNVIRPVVRLMSTWNVDPASAPPSVPPSVPESAPPLFPAAPPPHPEVAEASTIATTAVAQVVESVLGTRPETTSAARVCMRIIVQAARS